MSYVEMFLKQRRSPGNQKAGLSSFWSISCGRPFGALMPLFRTRDHMSEVCFFIVISCKYYVFTHMKKIIFLLLPALLFCGSKDAYTRIDPQAFSNTTGKSIAAIERSAMAFEVQKYEGGGALSRMGGVMTIRDKNGRLVDLPRAPLDLSLKDSSPAKYRGKELSHKLRQALLKKLAKNYGLSIKQNEQKIEHKDGFESGFSKKQKIDFYVDVQPDVWGLRSFEFDYNRYYYEYRAIMRIIDPAQGAVLGELECRYQSAPQRKVEYDIDARGYVYSYEDLEFFGKQPLFRDWFVKKGELLKEHTGKALQACLEDFEKKVMSPE